MFSNQHARDFNHSILLANNSNGDRVELKTDNNHNLRTTLIGNTNTNGSGDAHHLHVDSSGQAKVLLVGANDINGGTPHRHLTIDGNGRLLVAPYEHPNSFRTLHLEAIKNNTDKTRTHSTQSSINFADNATTNSNSVEIKNTTIGIIWKTQVSMLQNPEVQVSVDDSNWFTLKSGLSLGTFNLDMSGNYVLVTTIEVPFKYVRVSANQSGHGADITGDITFSNL